MPISIELGTVPDDICEMSPDNLIHEFHWHNEVSWPNAIPANAGMDKIWILHQQANINSLGGSMFIAETAVNVTTNDEYEFIFGSDDYGILYIDCENQITVPGWQQPQTKKITLSQGVKTIFILSENSGTNLARHSQWFFLKILKGSSLIYEARAPQWRTTFLTDDSYAAWKKKKEDAIRKAQEREEARKAMESCSAVLFGSNFSISPSTTSTKAPSASGTDLEALIKKLDRPCLCLSGLFDEYKHQYDDIIDAAQYIENKDVLGWIANTLIARDKSHYALCAFPYHHSMQREAILEYLKLHYQKYDFANSVYAKVSMFDISTAILTREFNARIDYPEAPGNIGLATKLCLFGNKKTVNFGESLWDWPKLKICNQNPKCAVYETIMPAGVPFPGHSYVPTINYYAVHVQADISKAVGNRMYLMMATLNIPEDGLYDFDFFSDDDHEIFINCEVVSTGEFGKHDKKIPLNKGPIQLIMRYKNIPDKTPGYIALNIWKNGNLLYQSRAADFKGQENAIGDITWTDGDDEVSPPDIPCSEPLPKLSVCYEDPKCTVKESFVANGNYMVDWGWKAEGDRYLLYVQADLWKAVGNRWYLMKGKLYAPENAIYSLNWYSDDNHEIYIDCKLFSTGGDRQTKKDINLSKGEHEIILRYQNIPNNTPGWMAVNMYNGASLVWQARAKDFKGQENQIGEINWSDEGPVSVPSYPCAS